MLRIPGNRKSLCTGIARRSLLHLGGLGAFGLTLADFLGLEPARAATRGRGSRFGQAKACILIYKYGSPPQQETFDPKPEAPAEIQGEMKGIETNVPGIRICEHLPGSRGSGTA